MRTVIALLLVVLFVVGVAANLMAFVFLLPVALVLGFWKVHKENKRFEAQCEEYRKQNQ